jgi:hypothetical protein
LLQPSVFSNDAAASNAKDVRLIQFHSESPPPKRDSILTLFLKRNESAKLAKP